MSQSGVYTAQLKKTDLHILLFQVLKMDTNQLCPLAAASKPAQPAPASPSADLLALARDDSFRKAASILAVPDLEISNRLGGGSVSYDMVKVYQRKGDNTLAVVAETADASLVIQRFADASAYTEWWVERFAGMNETPVVNFIPPETSLQSFLIILHVIDCFRRASYANALDYTPSTAVYISVDDFVKTMVRAVQSKDIRWLLPAFIHLTPGLPDFNLELQPAHLQEIVDRAFVRVARHPETGQDILEFAEAGFNMGVEFMKTWLLAASFAKRTLATTGINEGPVVFIAPTALANHYVQFKQAPDQQGLINHQAYTKNQLQVKLEEFIQGA